MHGPGAVIRAARKFRRVEKGAFAKAIGVSESTLYRLEHDDPRVEWVKIVDAAKQLGLVVDWKKKAVLPPKDLPPEMLNAGPAMRTIRVPADVYEGLQHKAGPGRTVEQFLASLTRGIKVIRSVEGPTDRVGQAPSSPRAH